MHLFQGFDPLAKEKFVPRFKKKGRSSAGSIERRKKQVAHEDQRVRSPKYELKFILCVKILATLGKNAIVFFLLLLLNIASSVVLVMATSSSSCVCSLFYVGLYGRGNCHITYVYQSSESLRTPGDKPNRDNRLILKVHAHSVCRKVYQSLYVLNATWF